MTNETIKLSSLKDGENGKIESVNVEGSLRRRLIEMGATPGTLVTVEKRAPMGDPIEISLRGYSLAMRGSDAARISVRREKRA